MKRGGSQFPIGALAVKKYLFSILIPLFPLLLNAQVPSSAHVVVVVEENHSYSSIIGNSAMPYLNSLARQNALATQYFANTHPSIGNYFMMTTGQIITNDDAFTGTVSVDNIVRHLLSAGKTWKSYAESLPFVGYTGGDSGAYLKHHNPFSYFSDVVNSSVEKLNLVPFTQFATDLNNNQLPEFSFVVPNVNDDAHNGTLQQADSWLQQHMGPLFNNPVFQKDGILIVVFDESVTSDTAGGGGHVAAVVAGPLAKKGFQTSNHYQHQNLLRTILSALGVSSAPGAASGAAAMADVFGSSSGGGGGNPPPGACSATTVGVTICSPKTGSTDASPVNFQAAANSGNPITVMQIYVDNQLAFKTNASSLNVNLPIAAGSHSIVVQAWDSAGAIFKSAVSITVSGGSTPPPPVPCSASTVGVTVCSPTAGSLDTSPVQFVAAAKSSTPITAMRIYVDNVSQFLSSSGSLNTSLPMSSGNHFVVVQAWDSTGAVFKAPLTISVK